MTRRAAPFWIPAMSLALLLPVATGRAQRPPAPSPAVVDPAFAPSSEGEASVREAIQRHLGRPYVWGACGLRSFDCSGFVWRVMQENGILVKRTTARKYYLSLLKVPVEHRWEFGNIVFFSNLKHCGIVDTREAFYHAAVTTGTHRSRFDPLWRRKVSGVRAMPRRGGEGAAVSSPRSLAAGSGG